MKCYIVHSKPYNEAEVYDVLKKFDIRTTSLATKADFVLAIGGDGAVIKAFHSDIIKNIPILGYNTGTLGFLSSGRDLNVLIEDYVNGELFEDKRQVLQCDYEREFKLKNKQPMDIALNEVAIVGQDTGKLVELDMSIDTKENIVTTYKGDGLIVATPTGSTAYNLSVGGPIIEPWSKSMVVSPISPFSLSSRPLVVDGDTVVYIDKCEKVMIDGRLVRYPQKTAIQVCMTGVYVTLLKRKGETFYESIKSKLHWEKSIK